MSQQNSSHNLQQTVSFSESKQQVFSQQPVIVQSSAFVGTSGANTIQELGASRLIKKVVHYENPRRYVQFNYHQSGNEYRQQHINYTQNDNSCNCNCACTCQVVQVSSNPNYRFKVTKEIDLKLDKQREDEYEQLNLKVQALETQHYQEINRLKEEFNAERSNYEKQFQKNAQEQSNSRSQDQQMHLTQVNQVQESKINELSLRNTELEKKSVKLECLLENNAKLEQKVSRQKEKKQQLSNELQELRKQLHEKDSQFRVIENTLKSKETFVNNTNNQNGNELGNENLYLIQELGRITEEYEALKQSCKVIEKPVYIPQVQNVTQIKEVPPYIEEKIVYVQDTEQLEQLQQVMNQLQQEVLQLTQEKQKIIITAAEEKAQLMEKVTKISQLQKTESSVLKEVIVQKVLDRSEVQQKEEEIVTLNAKLSEYSLRIAELEQINYNLLSEVQKIQRNYKIVKLPNNYKIEQTVSVQSQSMNQYSQCYLQNQ